MGVLSAGPVADGLAFILAVVLLLKETRSLKEGDSTEEKISNIKTIEEKNTSTPVIITIAREYGSGGRYIGKLVAEKLGIKIYDKEFIEKMVKELPPRQQEVFNLSRNAHLTYKEISIRLNISEKTVERHINEALKFLKKNIMLYLIFIF